LVNETPQGPVTLAPRLEVQSDGTIGLRGETTVNGNLRMAGGAVRFDDVASFTPENSPVIPSIYRFDDTGKEQLRIDLGAAGASPRQFVIGFSGADGKFTECLRIEMKNNTPVVTIRGDLVVEGKIANEKHPFPQLDQAALAAILGSFQAGIAAGNNTP
jgi:hypothetical protein